VIGSGLAIGEPLHGHGERNVPVGIALRIGAYVALFGSAVVSKKENGKLGIFGGVALVFLALPSVMFFVLLLGIVYGWIAHVAPFDRSEIAWGLVQGPIFLGLLFLLARALNLYPSSGKTANSEDARSYD
jgi:hypothetical protein